MQVDWQKSFTGRNVLVTGASGFMGANLVKRLHEYGVNTIALLYEWDPKSMLVRSGLVHQIGVYLGSVEDIALLNRIIRSEQIDTVFHLAAVATTGEAYKNPLHTFDVNIRGTYNILEACRTNSDLVARVVVASSDKAYGDAPQLPYRENMRMDGRAPYDVSKSCADLIARSYYSNYGLPVAVGRFGNIFGSGDLHWSRLVPGTIQRLLHNERPLVRQPIEDGFARDFLYVEDAVNSYFAMAAGLDSGAARGEAFNFAMGISWSPLNIVREIQKIMACTDVEAIFIPTEPGEIIHQHIDNGKAASLINWSPRWKLADGLAETVVWYRNYFASQAPHESRRFGSEQIAEITIAAAASPRLRHHLPLNEPMDPVQRILIGLQPGSYVRPHSHPVTKGRRNGESMVVLHGSIGIVYFDEVGEITAKQLLGPGEMVKVSDGLNHTVICLSPDTVLIEIKEEGRRHPDKRWLNRFPAEGSPLCPEFVREWEKIVRAIRPSMSEAAI